MKSRTALVLSLVSLYYQLPFQCAAEFDVNAGSWTSGVIPISELDSTLFTHLIFGYAYVNTSSFEVFIHQLDKQDFEVFCSTVKEKNPSIKTLLSIWGKNTYASMVRNPSSMTSFIRSSQNVARAHGFDGIDFYWDYPQTENDKKYMASLLREWRRYVDAYDPELILTATVPYSPDWPFNVQVYPIRPIARYVDWVHLKTFSYIIDRRGDVTAAHSALYDPSSNFSTDYGIDQWIRGGMKPSKMVMGLAFFGYAWNLANPANNTIGAPATGPALNKHDLGLMTYKEISDRIPSCGGHIQYSDIYKINYLSCGSTWIAYDDVEAIKMKVSYAKGKKLRGYFALHVSYDNNWLLSRAGHFS